MKVVNLSDKPSLLNQYLKELRSVDVQKDSMRFRRNVERIGEIMAVEISKQLTYAVEQVHRRWCHRLDGHGFGDGVLQFMESQSWTQLSN